MSSPIILEDPDDYLSIFRKIFLHVGVKIHYSRMLVHKDNFGRVLVIMYLTYQDKTGWWLKETVVKDLADCELFGQIPCLRGNDGIRIFKDRKKIIEMTRKNGISNDVIEGFVIHFIGPKSWYHCDGCTGYITGYRYCCVTCSKVSKSTFDICEKCKNLYVHRNNGTHELRKVEVTSMYDIFEKEDIPKNYPYGSLNGFLSEIKEFMQQVEDYERIKKFYQTNIPIIIKGYISNHHIRTIIIEELIDLLPKP